MSFPLTPGAVGELFWQVAEAVVLVQDDRILAWNPAAKRMFDLTPAEGAGLDETLGPMLGPAYDDVRTLLASPGAATVDATATAGLVLGVTTWQLADSDVLVLMLRDLTANRRLTSGFARLSALGREMLAGDPPLPDLLQQLVDEAKSLTSADFSALLLVREGHSGEVSHFVYNAPRELFPDQLPRTVGLLGVPINTGQVARLDDIRGHPMGEGIPVKHPPIGPLLAAPILAGERIVGEVAVANTPARRCFDEVDEQLIVDLAAHAGIAVQWGESRAEAAASAEARREIIATARHDIRNPLTIGKGYVSMLQNRRERMSPEQLASAIDAVRLAFDRIEDFAARALVDEASAVAEHQLQWSKVELHPLVQDIAAGHMAANREMNARIDVVVEDGTPEAFAGDPGMVREVLDNLVSNALKYGVPGTPVTITARPEGQQVRFDVHNVGEGIPAEDQQKLFERYWRAATVRDAAVPGSGLGLAIVRRLVELHDGVVGVTSRQHEGTTFWVTFPQSVPAEDDAEVAPAPT